MCLCQIVCPQTVITISDFEGAWCVFIFGLPFFPKHATYARITKEASLTIYEVLPSVYTFFASALKWQTTTSSRSLPANPRVRPSVKYSLWAAQKSSSPVGPSVYG